MRRIHTLIAVLVGLCFAASSNAEWQPGFSVPGLSGYKADVFPWGDFLVVCGSLYPDADRNIQTAAVLWDGRAWQDLRVPGEAYAAGTFQGHLVIGGNFPDFPVPNSTGHIAILNGTSWQPLGQGFQGLYGNVYALGSYRGQLVAGGNFSVAGSNGIATWDGSYWRPLGQGIQSRAWSIIEFNHKLYVGGTTDRSIWGGAIWDGTTWSPMDPSIETSIYDMVESNGTFYAVGRFHDPVNDIYWQAATWKGGKWQAFPDHYDTMISVAVHEGSVYVGLDTGDVGAGNCFAGNLLRLNGASWEPVTCLDGFGVGQICSWKSRLVIASGFEEVDGLVVNGIASFDSGRWSAFGQGLEFKDDDNLLDSRGTVRVDAVSATSLGIVAGGQFTFAGGLPAKNVAIWKGTGWQSFSTALSGSVHAVAEAGARVFVGGDFAATGEGYVTELDGGTWKSIGNSLSGPVRALFARGDHVIAGGAFGWASGTRVNGVAEWNGVQWSPLGAGLDDEVLALAEYQGRPVAAGQFVTSAGNMVNHVASFDGNVWVPLGTGTNGPILSAVEFGNLLVVGGDFSTAGGWPVSNVAAWDGRDWAPVGNSMDAPVRSLAVVNGVLVAGGSFIHADDAVVNHLAVFDGNAWRPVGEGTNGDVYSVAALPDSGIVVGGIFDRAGTTASSGIAIWPNSLPSFAARLESIKLPKLQASPNPFLSTTSLTFRIESQQRVTVLILDLQGRVVARPWEGTLQPGMHPVTWDGLTETRMPAPAGIYFAHVIGEGTRLSQKLVKISR